MEGATMTQADFLRQLDSTQFLKNERQWFPKWLSGYTQHHQLGDRQIPIEESLVFSFLRSLRDSNIPAWRRLQAAKALEAYQRLILRQHSVDFQPILNKLHQLSRRDSLIENSPGNATARVTEANLVPGEGNAGVIDTTEPEVIQRMRRTLRLLHHPKSTEKAYVGWVRRLIRHLADEQLDRYGEAAIGDFLADLAITHHVAAGTQNQALAACLFCYQKVLGRDLRFIHAVRAKASQYRPVVLTKNEVYELLNLLQGRNRIMFLLMYGSGLRHRECRSLRIKDICFSSRQIVVRNGKGMKDRVTVLPDCVVDGLQQQLELAECLHREDIEQGLVAQRCFDILMSSNRKRFNGPRKTHSLARRARISAIDTRAEINVTRRLVFTDANVSPSDIVGTRSRFDTVHLQTDVTFRM